MYLRELLRGALCSPLPERCFDHQNDGISNSPHPLQHLYIVPKNARLSFSAGFVRGGWLPKSMCCAGLTPFKTRLIFAPILSSQTKSGTDHGLHNDYDGHVAKPWSV